MSRATLLLGGCLLLAGPRPSAAQHLPLTPPAAPRVVALACVAVAPQATDIRGWLLLDQDIQLELEGAVQQLYNFKFDRAEKQFRSLRRRYPQHPGGDWPPTRPMTPATTRDFTPTSTRPK